jgi:HEAT repeat protein
VGAVENLLKEIQNPDPVKRRKAIWDLGQWGDTRAVQPLVDLMLDGDSKQRSLILSALSEIGTRTIKPMSKALAISLQDDNADVRKNAIRDLTRIYDLVAQVSQMVQKCSVDDPDDEVRETATWALKQLNRIRPVSLDGMAALSAAVSPPENL